jgi:hypothetical protein
VLVTLILAPVSQGFKLMFIVPHVALNSSMACRVFRGLKLGLIEDIDEFSVQLNSTRTGSSRHPSTKVHSNTLHLSRVDSKSLGHYPTIRLELGAESSHEHIDEGSKDNSSVDPSHWA